MRTEKGKKRGDTPFFPVNNNYIHSGTRTRVVIATQIAAALAASDKTFDDDSFLVKRAYKIADEIIDQSVSDEVQKET